MPSWNTENGMRDYGLGNLGETVGGPQWRLVRDLDGAKPICRNCKGRIVQIRVRTKSARLAGGEGWSYYFGCPCCPWASPALLVSDRAAPPYVDGLAASPWYSPDTPLQALDPVVVTLEAAETLLSAEPAPTDLSVKVREAIHAALRALKGTP